MPTHVWLAAADRLCAATEAEHRCPVTGLPGDDGKLTTDAGDAIGSEYDAWALLAYLVVKVKKVRGLLNGVADWHLAGDGEAALHIDGSSWHLLTVPACSKPRQKSCSLTAPWCCQASAQIMADRQYSFSAAQQKARWADPPQLTVSSPAVPAMERPRRPGIFTPCPACPDAPLAGAVGKACCLAPPARVPLMRGDQAATAVRPRIAADACKTPAKRVVRWQSVNAPVSTRLGSTPSCRRA